MSGDFSKADAKAYASSYLLLGLLQRMDVKEPGLIDDLLAGAKRDFEAVSSQGDVTGPASMIFEEAIGMLIRANAYRLNAQDRRATSIDTPDA